MRRLVGEGGFLLTNLRIFSKQILFLQFKSANAADEKTALMERFLESLWSQLEKCDGSMIWALSTSEAQLGLCRLTVERAVVGQIFAHAMYPNGEADISRDEVGFYISLS